MNSFNLSFKDETGIIRDIASTWYFNRVGAGIEIDISLDHNDIRLKTFITPSDPELFSVDKFETGEWLPDFVNNVIFHNDDKIYVVPLDNFGVRDLKFIIPCEEKELQIYMTTDVEVSDPSRPITFSNFEVFNKQEDNLIVECTVDFKGFNFTSHINGKGVDTERLNFIYPLIGYRIAIYESDLYKNGCLDFHKFVKELDLVNLNVTCDNDCSNFIRNKFSSKKNSIYTSKDGFYSLIMFEDKSALYVKLYKDILEQVTKSIYLTKNMKSDLECMLNRWFITNLSFEKNMMSEIVTLDKLISSFIDIGCTIRKVIAERDRKNDVLY